MNQEVERKILELAVEREILSGDDLQKVRTEWEESGERAEGPSSKLVDLLVEKGLLHRSTVETLTSEVIGAGGRDARATNSSNSELDTASALITYEDIVPETFGRYQRLEFLGKGGMAKVYKAYDPSLNSDCWIEVCPVGKPRTHRAPHAGGKGAGEDRSR